MKTIFKSLLALAISLSLFSCNKEIDTTMTGYFYTTDKPVHETSLRLSIDGVDVGVLPYIDQPYITADRNDTAMLHKALKLDFASGKHLFESKTPDGILVSSSIQKFTFSKRKKGTEGFSPVGSSGSMTLNNETTVLIWLSSETK